MKLAIFDVDGTLVDSQAMIAASLTAAFSAEGLALPQRSRMMSIVGLSLVDAMAALAPDHGAAGHQRLAAAYKEAFWQHRARGEHTEELFPGAHELLLKLRARDDVALGIATGKSRRGVAHLIERHGYEGWFATIQTSDDHPSKPHPSMIVTALAETGRALCCNHGRRYDLRCRHGPCSRGRRRRSGVGQSRRRRPGEGRRTQYFK